MFYHMDLTAVPCHHSASHVCYFVHVIFPLRGLQVGGQMNKMDIISGANLGDSDAIANQD